MKQRYFILLIFSALFFSCNPVECFRGAGENTSEERQISNFNTLIIQDNIEVVLENRDDLTIRLEGGKNILKNITTENQGDVLTLKNDNSCNFARSYEKGGVRIFIPAQNIERIEQLGFATVSSSEEIILNKNLLSILCEGTGNMMLNLQAKKIDFLLESVSVIEFIGRAENLTLNIEGLGKVSAEKMQADTCVINHKDLNEVKVFPIQRLDVTITNRGKVIYFNQPNEIIQNISGAGQLFSNP